jgi:flagellar basal-body rod protein FlgB
MNWLDSVSSSLLTKSLDGLWARQQAIQENIANYETPGYKKKTVSFEEELANAISNRKQTRLETIQKVKQTGISERIVEEENLRADGNNVDVDKENIELARAQLQYSMAIRQLNDYYSRLRIAITGGVK